MGQQVIDSVMLVIYSIGIPTPIDLLFYCKDFRQNDASIDAWYIGCVQMDSDSGWLFHQHLIGFEVKTHGQSNCIMPVGVWTVYTYSPLYASN